MRVEKAGEGEPELAVVASLHGDEPCGKNAIERFLSEDWKIKEPVKLVIANEESLEENERFLEADLNRSFPGDPDSELHEERLAAEIIEEVENLKVLDLHSTHYEPVPFAIFSNLNPRTYSVLESTGVENAVHFPETAGSLNDKVDGVVVEVGKQGTPEATEMAYNVLVNFLASQGVIETEYEESEPDIFRYTGKVEGGGYRFLGENFRKVEAGEVFAERDGEEVRAEEEFYPVLMSTSGYKDKLGFKTEKIDISEEIKEL